MERAIRKAAAAMTTSIITLMIILIRNILKTGALIIA
jgi:hypothetical protein